MSDLLNQYQNFSRQSLGQAKSLPFEVYRSSEVYQTECKSVFRNEWIFICGEHEIANPGDYFAFTLAGESLAIVRGQDSTLRALSNNCRHRGTPLLDEGFGSTGKLIVCPYHAWSYDHSGELKGVPFAEKGEVDKNAHCLPAFHLRTMLGLIFINLSDNPSSFEKRFEGIEEYAQCFEPSRFNQALPGNTEQWQANWKLAMENAMESYHLFKVHKETLETVTPSKQAYYVAGSSEWSLTGGAMVGETSSIMDWITGKPPEIMNHYLLISLPPSFVGIMSYDSFGWISVLPIDSEHSTIRAGAAIEAGQGNESEESINFTQAFFAEDKWICERVQKGMASQCGLGGKLIDKERIVVDFHQFLASRLFDCPPTEHFDNPESTVFHQP